MRPNVTMTILGGLIGTPAMTVLLYVLGPVLGVKMDIVAMLAAMLGGWNTGMLLHILNGTLIFPLAYVFLFSRMLPGPPAIKGLSFGIVLWLAAELIVLPLMGAGLFSAQIGGIKAAGALLLGNMVYGGSVGLFPTFVQEDLPAGKPRVASR